MTNDICRLKSWSTCSYNWKPFTIIWDGAIANGMEIKFEIYYNEISKCFRLLNSNHFPLSIDVSNTQWNHIGMLSITESIKKCLMASKALTRNEYEKAAIAYDCWWCGEMIIYCISFHVFSLSLPIHLFHRRVTWRHEPTKPQFLSLEMNPHIHSGMTMPDSISAWRMRSKATIFFMSPNLLPFFFFLFFVFLRDMRRTQCTEPVVMHLLFINTKLFIRNWD